MSSLANRYIDLSIWICNYVRSTLELLQAASLGGSAADGYAMGIINAMSDPLAPLSRSEAMDKLDMHKRLLETSLLQEQARQDQRRRQE